MPDYIPERDLSFKDWLTNLADYAAAHAGELPLTPAERAALSSAAAAFAADQEASYLAHVHAASLRVNKDQTRQAAEAVARGAVRKIQAAAGVTDEQRASLAITRPDRRRTRVGPPEEKPIVALERIASGYQVLRILPGPAIGRRAKPRDTVGAEVWMTIAAPENIAAAEMRYGGLATSGSYTAAFTADQAGQHVQYKTRWINRRGETGPWSEAAGGTIAA